MEHSDFTSRLKALNEFSKLDETAQAKVLDTPSSEMCEVLDLILREVADDGIVRYPWKKLKYFFAQKLQNVLFTYIRQYPDYDSVEEESSLEFNQYVNSLKSDIYHFKGPPFTIQRLSELLVDPQRAYTSTRKLINALEKLIQVISIISLHLPNGLTSSEDETSESIEKPQRASKVAKAEVKAEVLSPSSPLPSPANSTTSSGRKRKAANQSPGTRPLKHAEICSEYEDQGEIDSIKTEDMKSDREEVVKKEEMLHEIKYEVNTEETQDAENAKNENQKIEVTGRLEVPTDKITENAEVKDIDEEVHQENCESKTCESKKNKTSPIKSAESFPDEKRQKNINEEHVTT